jgi:DnaJ family protein A protein 2
VKFDEEGDQNPGMTPGDVIVVLEQTPHSYFQRTADGPHLMLQKHISLAEALTGFSFNVMALDGRELKVTSEAGKCYKPGDIKAIRDEGMPIKNTQEKGNLYVEIKVDFPTTYDAKNKEALTALLPGPSAKNKTSHKFEISKKANYDVQNLEQDAEEVDMVSVDLQAEKRKYAALMQQAQAAHGEHDDDEHGHPQAQQVQCGNQ